MIRANLPVMTATCVATARLLRTTICERLSTQVAHEQRPHREGLVAVFHAKWIFH
jgi:hypothetical protein